MNRQAGSHSHPSGGRQGGNPSIVQAVLVGILVAVAFWFWYCWAADYGYSAVSGTYTFDGDGERCTLVPLENRVFRQELRHAGTVERAQGRWRRIGEGGVVFSKEFIKVGRQTVRQDGQADGEVRKTSGGLLLSIEFTGNDTGPVFRRRVFR